MSKTRSARRFRRSGGAEINMAPLIDMIFILLIFFVVTTSFVRESGVEIERPSAQSAVPKETVQMLVEVDRTGTIFMGGEAVDIRSLQSRMRQFLTETPDPAVVVVADRTSRTGTVIQVLDQCRLAGVDNISVAARRPE